MIPGCVLNIEISEAAAGQRPGHNAWIMPHVTEGLSSLRFKLSEDTPPPPPLGTN